MSVPRPCALLVLALTVVSCTAPTTVVPSPTPTASPTATATPAGSPTASPRALRPFTGVVPIAAMPPDPPITPDRGRVAYLVQAGELAVLDASSQQHRVVRRSPSAFALQIGEHGLRADTVVFQETRSEGGRTDTLILRLDLASGALVTLDDYSGPFLGLGPHSWYPAPPITNGRDAAWIRVDDERDPFAVHVVLSRGGAAGSVLRTGTSAVWIDLDDKGRVLISTLISEGEVAELLLWQDGVLTSLGTRPSEQGGPAVFLGDHVFWQRGTGSVRRVEEGDLIEIGGRVRPITFPGCGPVGHTARHLVLFCDSAVLLDAVTGERFPLPGLPPSAGSRAVAWREGTQWWLGTIAQ